MRMLLAAALVAFSSFAVAQTRPPLPDTPASQQDAVKKAWIRHAIEHLLNGPDEHAERGDAVHVD